MQQAIANNSEFAAFVGELVHVLDPTSKPVPVEREYAYEEVVGALAQLVEQAQQPRLF